MSYPLRVWSAAEADLAEASQFESGNVAVLAVFHLARDPQRIKEMLDNRIGEL